MNDYYLPETRLAFGVVQPPLFRQSATDPALFAWVALVLLAAALRASAIPALRATQLHAPLVALRPGWVEIGATSSATR